MGYDRYDRERREWSQREDEEASRPQWQQRRGRGFESGRYWRDDEPQRDDWEPRYPRPDRGAPEYSASPWELERRRYGEGRYGDMPERERRGYSRDDEDEWDERGYVRREGGYGGEWNLSGPRYDYEEARYPDRSRYGAGGGGGRPWRYRRGRPFDEGDDPRQRDERYGGRGGRGDVRGGERERYYGEPDERYRAGRGYDPRAYDEDERYYGYGQSDRDLGGGRANRQRFTQPPRGYKRSDERIREDVCDTLMRRPDIDASDIEVQVKDGEVMLQGTVPHRAAKFVAEEACESILGVKDISNSLRLRQEGQQNQQGNNNASSGAQSGPSWPNSSSTPS